MKSLLEFMKEPECRKQYLRCRLIGGVSVEWRPIDSPLIPESHRGLYAEVKVSPEGRVPYMMASIKVEGDDFDAAFASACRHIADAEAERWLSEASRGEHGGSVVTIGIPASALEDFKKLLASSNQPALQRLMELEWKPDMEKVPLFSPPLLLDNAYAEK